MGTLANIWATYKGDIIPVITTGVLVILSALFVFIASKIKSQGYKAEAQAKVLTELQENKQNVEPVIQETKTEVEKLKDTIRIMKDSIFYLAELFNTAFQESDLSPETKESLKNLCNKVKNGVSEEIILNLEAEIDKYKALYDSTVEKLKETEEKIMEANEVKPTKKVRK